MKLLIEEEGSVAVETAAETASSLAASPLAYVEARSTLGRGVLQGRFSTAADRTARAALERYWSHMAVIALDGEVTSDAGEIAHRLGLRGADAVHLASAKRLSGAAGEPVVFATWDERLRSAARRERLATLPT